LLSTGALACASGFICGKHEMMGGYIPCCD
jgi:hypothetical protein